jgi:hypothetical protein
VKLIPNWRRAWRMLTVQIGVLAVVWVALPAATQEHVLAALGVPREALPAILGVLVIVARLIAQPGVSDRQ